MTFFKAFSVITSVLCCFILLSVPAFSQDMAPHAGMAMDHDSQHSSMDHSGHARMADSGATAMDHSAHQAMMAEKNSLVQSQVVYHIPDVELIDQNGQKVKLDVFLADSEPYALNFIFTTCTTICPVLTASFAQMQRQLGPEADGLQLISITIDPEYDTPQVLKSYSEKVRAKKNWTFLTGDFQDIVTTEESFAAVTADKMNHKPVYFFKTRGNAEWTRVDGLAGGGELADIYRKNAAL
ncbi:MAG: SCO family protein [Desulfuromonas sp.]|nr:MAG: SCO family protein [Desulfuromonas sp.]